MASWMVPEHVKMVTFRSILAVPEAHQLMQGFAEHRSSSGFSKLRFERQVQLKMQLLDNHLSENEILNRSYLLEYNDITQEFKVSGDDLINFNDLALQIRVIEKVYEKFLSGVEPSLPAKMEDARATFKKVEERREVSQARQRELTQLSKGVSKIAVAAHLELAGFPEAQSKIFKFLKDEFGVETASEEGDVERLLSGAFRGGGRAMG